MYAGIGKLASRLYRFSMPMLAVLVLLPGCLGVSANPFRLGNLPGNDIIRTHAKPTLRGNYHDFDPAAKNLTVTPVEDVNIVRTQHVLVATVCDKDNNGRRNRRVEWHVSGVGHIVEVDESGLMPGRGYLVDDKYAVSYTNYRAHKLTRGNDKPGDDIDLKAGQTWCTITSAEEGDTYITAYAPGIYDWEKHKVFAVKHWIDAEACFPPNATNPAGQPHTLRTRVIHASDKSPAQGYRVRYRIVDGPPAVLEPGASQQVDTVSDPDGYAAVTLRQLQPTQGTNRVCIDVVRPSEKRTGKEILVTHGEFCKTWVSPNISVQKVGPTAAAVGQQIPYTITVTNTGSVATNGGQIRDSVPDGVKLVGTQPQAALNGRDLVWQFGPLAPGQSVQVQMALQAAQAGTLNNCAEAVLAEGMGGKSCTTTQVVTANLAVSKRGPPTGIVGQQLNFEIVVQNNGQAPAMNVNVTDFFEQGFSHQTSNSGQLQLPVIPQLAPGQSLVIPVTLTAKLAGRFCNRVQATADGGLTAQAEHCVIVAQPQISIRKTGPAFAFVGAQVSYDIFVRNSGEVPIGNVFVRDQVPAQLRPQMASSGGSIQGSVVTWNLGTLPPGQEARLQLQSQAVEMGQNICNSATVNGDGVAQQSQPTCLTIKGVPALLTELIDRLDPVPVGGETTYAIQVRNTGSVIANQVQVTCTYPASMEFVNAEGQTGHRHDPLSRTVQFAPFDGMEPGKQLLYQVQCKALRPGDVRFQVKVTSDALQSPVNKEESTQIYNPQTGETRGGVSKRDDIATPLLDENVLAPVGGPDFRLLVPTAPQGTSDSNGQNADSKTPESKPKSANKSEPTTEPGARVATLTSELKVPALPALVTVAKPEQKPAQ